MHVIIIYGFNFAENKKPIKKPKKKPTYEQIFKKGIKKNRNYLKLTS